MMHTNRNVVERQTAIDDTYIDDGQRWISSCDELLDGLQRGATSFLQCDDGFFHQVEVGFLRSTGHGTI